MRRIAVLLVTACSAALVAPATAASPGGQLPGVLAVRVDSARHTVVLAAGPFDLPADHGGDHGGGMDAHTLAPPLLKFSWPVDGWIRGMKLRVVDRGGRPLPRALVHHLMVINFARRQLLYPQAERLIGVGQETGDLRLPATIGIPVSATMPMAVILAWHNGGPESVAGATVEVRIDWTPSRMVPRPVSVLPVPMSVIYPVGRAGDFDLPAGPTRWTSDFRLDLGGRIVVAGGHLHDYGAGFELQEITTGSSRSILRLNSKLTAAGKLLAVDRVLPGAAGDGIKLSAGHTYRLIATYDNPTGGTLVKGAMANLILLFAPDHIESWPAVPANDAEYQKDLRYLESLGTKSETP